MVDEERKNEYDSIPVYVSEMWFEIAEKFRFSVSDCIISGDYKEAMRLAQYAEACYWQARGESNSMSVNDLLNLGKTDEQEH